MFLFQGFPVCEPDIEIAGTILHEEIARGHAEKLTLDNGKIFYFIYSGRCLSKQFLAYEQTRKMNVIVMCFPYSDM